MAELSDLLEEVKAATGPDRELDRDIGLAIGGWKRETPKGFDGQFLLIDEEYFPDHPGAMYPALTESIDMALALVEKLGWCVHMLHMGPQGSRGGASVDLCPPNQADKNFDAEAATPPLAILAALLTALKGQAQ